MLARHYAHALYQATEKVSGRELGSRLKSFADVLARKGHERLLRSIVREYENYRLRLERRRTVTVSVASHKEEAVAKKHLKEYRQFAEKEVVVSVDPDLIRGFRIEGNDTLFDGSAKQHLITLYRKLIS